MGPRIFALTADVCDVRWQAPIDDWVSLMLHVTESGWSWNERVRHSVQQAVNVATCWSRAAATMKQEDVRDARGEAVQNTLPLPWIMISKREREETVGLTCRSCSLIVSCC